MRAAHLHTLADQSVGRSIVYWADIHNIPAELVVGIAMAESRGEPSLWRAEPKYPYLYDVKKLGPFRGCTAGELAASRPPADFPSIRGVSSRATEWWGQRASWGPMQVMGGVAREHGFRKAFPLLCTASRGVEYGMIHLAGFRERYFEKWGWAGVVAAYNYGHPLRAKGGLGDDFVNQKYVDRVKKHSLMTAEAFYKVGGG